METEDYLALFYPFEQLDMVKKGVESDWTVSNDRTMIALTMTFADEPMAKTMSFQREYAEPYDWIAQQLKDWAFTLTTSNFVITTITIPSMRELGTCTARRWRPLAGSRPATTSSCWKSRRFTGTSTRFCLGIQMMFSFMLVDEARPAAAVQALPEGVYEQPRQTPFFAAHGARTSIMFIKAGENRKNRMVTKMPESQNTEWKSKWKDEYLEWICGYANAQGGKIYIGCDDEGNVLGLPNARKLLEDIPNKIRDAMGIIVGVNLLDEDGKEYIEIDVPPYPSAISCKGVYYYRSGSTRQILTGPALEAFLMRKRGATWGQSAATGFFAGRCG